MEGSIRNILNLYFAAPDKILLDWSVRSPIDQRERVPYFLFETAKKNGFTTSA